MIQQPKGTCWECGIEGVLAKEIACYGKFRPSNLMCKKCGPRRSSK